MVLMSNCFSEKKMIPTQVHCHLAIRASDKKSCDAVICLKMDRLTDGLAYNQIHLFVSITRPTSETTEYTKSGL